jgi:Protein of unknown function (DUF2442)
MSEFGPLVHVTAVRVLARYVVELDFDDGTTRVIDLEPLLWGEMFDPIRADYETFSKVRVDVDAATVVWPNGADISPRTLYAESMPTVPV